MWFGKKKPAPSGQTPDAPLDIFKPPSAFVLFRSQPDWSGPTLRARFEALFPEHASRWDFPRTEGSSALITVSDVNFAGVSIGAPVPGADFAQEIRLSPWWPDAEASVASHRAHTLLLTPDQNWPTRTAQERLQRIMDFGRVLAAFASLEEALAVNWIENGSMYPAEIAVQMLQAGPPPVFWVRTWTFEAARPNGARGVGAFTKGLRVFCGRELEFEPVSPENAQQAASYCERLGEYLISEGPVLGDGDTLEFEPGQKIEVSHSIAPGGVPIYSVKL